MRAWRGTAFAHRGLHGNGVVENTLPAFRAAREKGYGVELDVRLSRDGQVIVFHDDTLTRLAGDDRPCEALRYDELSALSLRGGEGSIPTFRQALEILDGKVPLLVEIKNCDNWRVLCKKTCVLLSAYRGPVLVESFNPLIVRWFRKNHPEYPRGQLVGRPVSYVAARMGIAGALLLSSLALNWLSRPNFIAYDVHCGRCAAPRLNCAVFHSAAAVWTVRDRETFEKARARGLMVIFEE